MNTIENKLLQINQTIETIFSKLLKKDQVTKYRLLSKRLIDNNEICTLLYEAILSKTDRYKVTFLFRVMVPWREKYNHTFTTSRHEIIDLSRNFLLEDTDKVCALLSLQVDSWRKGEQNERYFFKDFLKPLQRKYPRILLSVEKSPNEIDKVHGFDFTILFETDTPGELKHVHFNLKSSNCFLEQHKKRFPDISTFVFNSSDLKNPEELEDKFLLFMFSSQYKTVHF